MTWGSGGDLDKPDDQMHYIYTWYVNDALGNVQSTYKQEYFDGTLDLAEITQTDVMLDGQGVYNPQGRVVSYSLTGLDFETVETATLTSGDPYER